MSGSNPRVCTDARCVREQSGGAGRLARNGGMLRSQRAWLGDDRTQRARGEGRLLGEASNSHGATPGGRTRTRGSPAPSRACADVSNVTSAQRKLGSREVGLNKLSVQDVVRAISGMILGVTWAPITTNILTEKKKSNLPACIPKLFWVMDEGLAEHLTKK